MRFSNLNVSTFSTYLENNPMLRYFDNSAKMNMGVDTMNFDTNGLTKPTAFFLRRSDKDLFWKSNEKSVSPNKNELEFPIIPICENVNNAFINMNVNMSVTNNTPINNTKGNTTNTYSGNIFLDPQHLLGQGNVKTNNTNNSNENPKLKKNTTNKSMGNYNHFHNEYDNFDESEHNQHNFSPICNNSMYHNDKIKNNNNDSFDNFSVSNNINEFGRGNNRNAFSSREMNNNYYMVNQNMNYYNYPNNHINPKNMNQFKNNGGIDNTNFPIPIPNNNFYNNLTRNTKRSNTYGCSSNSTIHFNNFDNNMINNKTPYQVNQREPYAYLNPNIIKNYNNNISNLTSNLRSFNTRDVNRPSKTKQNLPNYTTMDNSELAKYIYHLAKDQAGCRFIQKKMDDEGNTIINLIYPGIMEHLVELINDSFGNYLIQKLFMFLSEQQFFQVLGIINPQIELIGTNSHGTRVLQRLIDFLNTENLILSFGSVIRSSIVELMKDINGSHIILKFFNTFDLSYTEFAYEILNQNLIEISLHKNGCCTMQKCLEIADLLIKREIIINIIENCLTLITDPYGNYVVQHVIYLRDFEDNRKIIMNLIKDILFFSKQKYSSNVVEKCFDNCDEETRNILIYTLLKKEIITELLFDMYGNYVVQKLLAVTTNENRNFMLTIIAPLMERLRLFNFGPKIYNKLILTYPQLSSLMFSINITNISNNNSGKSSLNNSKDGIKSTSCESVHNQNIKRDQKYSHTISRFANNQQSKFSQPLEVNLEKPKHKNSN